MPSIPAITELAHCHSGVLTVLWLGALIATAICGLLVYSIIKFHNAPDNSTGPFVRRTTMEVAWAIIPILILISTAAPSVKALVVAENGCHFAPGNECSRNHKLTLGCNH